MDEKYILITNGRVILPSGGSNSNILVKGKTIIGVFPKSGKRSFPENTLIIDANDNYVSAGFIDIHIHGETSSIAKTNPSSGVTSFLRALSTDEISKIDEIGTAGIFSGFDSKFLGYYLEGPFISRIKKGSQDPKFIKRPDKKTFDKVLRRYGSLIRVMVFAPELGGNQKLIKEATRKGVIASLGHTDASFEAAQKGFSCGARLATHLFNAMSGISGRVPGCVLASLMNRNIYTEVILDGIHISPEIFKLVLRVKELEKIILISDSISNTDLKKNSIVRHGRIFKTRDGAIAGSDLKLNIALRNCIKFTSLGLADAIKFVTINPARLLGIDKRKGSIQEGKDADIVIFDKNFNINLTMVEGKIVYNKNSTSTFVHRTS